MILDDAKDGITDLVCWDKEIIVASSDGRLRSYDVRMGKCVTDVQPGAVTSLALSRDGRVLLVSCLDGKIRLMDRENGSCLRTFPPPEKMGDDGYKNEGLRLQTSLAVNDSVAMSGSESDGKARAWDVVSGKLIGNVDVSESGKVVSVVKWREGSQVEDRKSVWAAGGADGIVKVFG